MIPNPCITRPLIDALRHEIPLPHPQPHVPIALLARDILRRHQQLAAHPSPVRVREDVDALQLADAVAGEVGEAGLGGLFGHLDEADDLVRGGGGVGDEEVMIRGGEFGLDGGQGVGGADVGFEVWGWDGEAEGVGEDGGAELGDLGGVGGGGGADVEGGFLGRRGASVGFGGC